MTERTLKGNCLRCDGLMSSIGVKKLQLGQTGWLLGDLPNLLAGAMEVEVRVCIKCGKIEFFHAQDEKCEGRIAQIKCPTCGKSHDMDYPKCPFCKHDYRIK